MHRRMLALILLLIPRVFLPLPRVTVDLRRRLLPLRFYPIYLFYGPASSDHGSPLVRPFSILIPQLVDAQPYKLRGFLEPWEDRHPAHPESLADYPVLVDHEDEDYALAQPGSRVPNPDIPLTPLARDPAQNLPVVTHLVVSARYLQEPHDAQEQQQKRPEPHLRLSPFPSPRPPNKGRTAMCHNIRDFFTGEEQKSRRADFLRLLGGRG